MTPAPVVILSAPHSQAAHVTAVLGSHPRAFALPDLRIFDCERVNERLALANHGDTRANDGLLRAVAQLFCGGQGRTHIRQARRMLDHRREWRCRDLLAWIVDRIAPQTAVIYDTSAPLHIVPLDRWRDEAPDAAFVHLLRHPVDFVQAAQRFINDRLYVPPDYSNHAGPPRLDPQLLWYRVHDTLEREMASGDFNQHQRLHLEALQGQFDTTVIALCRWLGWSHDADARRAMTRTGDIAFAHRGPVNAPEGMERDFLAMPWLVTPLGTRVDTPKMANAGLYADVINKACAFGYR